MTDPTPFQSAAASVAPATNHPSDEELLADLADEFTARVRRGEGPSLDEYARRYPALADQIRDLFPALIAMEQPGVAATLDLAPAVERVGATIGRYKLLERIGEGGFGVVFMAEQQHPVRRKVALKVIKPGVDTRQVIARFEAERQALALMDHENIARVFDAGATESGRPYFVMELVRGVAITEFCDKSQLPTRERLRLFLQVCRAVQHAHTKGIIHRDLKPTNVLVTLHDGVPVPKVIDFGVAKATGQQLTERTLFTNFAQMVGTPLYMSPEQAEMSGLDVDTRSDVYSLGVLLYELLTGTTPFDKDRLKSAALDEVRRIIREEEPPRPSTRVSTMGEQALRGVSAHRGSDARRLGQMIRGELDWIVMRALDKDRTRRYETAVGLARDVERYLHDEPVEACPPSAVYRLRKFARRYRTGMTIALVALASLLVLVGALAVSNRMIAAERNEKAAALREREVALAAARDSAARAEAQRKRAETNFLKARIAVRDGLIRPAQGIGVWSGLSPAQRKLFANAVIKFYEESMLHEGSSDPSLRYETAVGYRSIAYVHDSTGERAQAERLIDKSIEMLTELSREHPGAVEYRHQLGWSHFMRAMILRGLKRPAEALAALRRAAELYDQLLAERPDLADLSVDGVAVFRWLGEMLMADKQFDEAERALRRSIDLHERPTAVDPTLPANPTQAAGSYSALIGLYARTGRVGELAGLAALRGGNAVTRPRRKLVPRQPLLPADNVPVRPFPP